MIQFPSSPVFRIDHHDAQRRAWVRKMQADHDRQYLATERAKKLEYLGDRYSCHRYSTFVWSLDPRVLK